MSFFFYLFLLLSFWFKFSCIIFFENIKVTEGDFDVLNANFDKTSKIIIFSFLTCVFFSMVRKFLLQNTLKKKIKIRNSVEIFYRNNRLLIVFLYFVFVILIWTINYKFSIYSKGIINQNIPPIVKYFFSWSFTYGLSIITSIFIYIDFVIFKEKRIFIVGIIETLFTHLTIFSRAFLTSIIAYLRGYHYLLKFFEIKLYKKFILKISSIIILFSILTFFSVNELRHQNFKNNDINNSLILKQNFFEFIHLSVNRWVGIDALLTVSQSKNLDFNLFISSLVEKKQIRQKSFYIDNFFKSFTYGENEKENLNIVITPGLIPYLYYSGSIIFVCFSLIIVLFLCSTIETFFLNFSRNNIVLSNLIGYALAIRFIHFGYVPYNTINFMFSFLILLILVYFFTRLISSKD